MIRVIEISKDKIHKIEYWCQAQKQNLGHLVYDYFSVFQILLGLICNVLSFILRNIISIAWYYLKKSFLVANIIHIEYLFVSFKVDVKEYVIYACKKNVWQIPNDPNIDDFNIWCFGQLCIYRIQKRREDKKNGDWSHEFVTKVINLDW